DRMACGELLWCRNAIFQHHLLERGGPQTVVAKIEILWRRDAFALEPESIEIPEFGDAGHHIEGERHALPTRVKHPLIRFGHNRPKAVHAAHVGRAIHGSSPGCLGRPVPIMLSRVTSSTSFPSLQPSVPAGRIGTTR